jgi:hypothetical protein
MMRGLAAAYTVVVIAYFPVASAGYAAFGNVVSPDVLLSVRKPAWLISIANFMVVIHLAASYQVTLRPPTCAQCVSLVRWLRDHSPSHPGINEMITSSTCHAQTLAPELARPGHSWLSDVESRLKPS